MSKIVFLDMDGVLADFDGAITSGVTPDPPEMFIPGFFRNLKVMDGAKEAVAALLANKDLEIYIGSKMTSKITTCASEKMEWIKEHFPELLRNMVLVCDKKLLRGDVLVDDDMERWGHKFQGQFIHFDRSRPKESWELVVKELCKMKVIFLDFDGVLNSATSFLYEDFRRKHDNEQGIKGPVNETLSLHCCAALREVLVTYPEVKIVLSTTWRDMFDMDWLKAKLEEYHIDSSRVIGKTPVDRYAGSRGAEIQWWLDTHPEVTHYVAIDDNDWEITHYHGADRFVKTDWDRGMGLSHAKELIKKLSAKNQKAVAERLENEKTKEEFDKDSLKNNSSF